MNNRVTTINNIDMISCGYYYWEILIEEDESEVFRIFIPRHEESNIACYYEQDMLSIHTRKEVLYFKIPFEQTHIFIKSLIEGEETRLMPIYHKDTIKIK